MVTRRIENLKILPRLHERVQAKLLLLLERTVALRRVHAFQTSKAVLKSGYQVQQIRRNLAILPGPNEQASGIHLLRDERDQFGSNEFSIGTQSIPLPPLQPPTSTPTPTLPLPAAQHCSTETQRNSEQLVLAGLVFTCVSQSSPRDAFGSCKKCISCSCCCCRSCHYSCMHRSDLRRSLSVRVMSA